METADGNPADESISPPDQQAWDARCLARMLELDPAADRALLGPIVRDMSASANWKSRTPEAAAEWCFGPLESNGKPPGRIGRLSDGNVDPTTGPS